MNELARTDFQPFEPLEPVQYTQRGGDQFERMGKWLELFMSTARVAEVLARTAFVPEPMRGQPENIAAAMMKALELGIDPLDGLASIHVVKGKIGFSAEFMRRRILEAGHEFEFVESTDERCRIKGRRAGAQEWQTVTFTADQARKAKIVLGDYPADKLVARASSRLCKRVFPDVLAGAHIIDDLDDEPETNTGSTVQRKRQPRTVKPAATPPQEEPALPAASAVDELLDDEPPPVEPEQQTLNTDPEPEPESGEESITKPQLQKLSILLKEAGFDDRQAAHDFTASFVQHPVTSAKELTKREASDLIDTLENERNDA